MLYKYSEQQWTTVYIELSHLRFQIDKNLHHDQAMLKWPRTCFSLQILSIDLHLCVSLCVCVCGERRDQHFKNCLCEMLIELLFISTDTK